MRVTFLGVRGSTPSPGEATLGYGGNTTCVLVEPTAGPPVLCDLGTGTRRLEPPFVGVCVLTHLHFDHVQGLPFANALIHPDTSVELYGPPQDDGGLEAAIRRFLHPPVFPVTLDELPGDFRFHEVVDGRHEVAPGVTIQVGRVPHPGHTNGYRIEADGRAVAFVPDHQQPDDLDHVAADVLALARDVDLLIHDAQYTPAEFELKRTWGHCTVRYAVNVARAAGAARLALFHHDPAHDDATVDEMAEVGRELAGDDLEILAARETAVVDLAPVTPAVAPGSGGC